MNEERTLTKDRSSYQVLHTEKVWKSETECANALFKKDKFINSLEGYKVALAKSEILNNDMANAKNSGIPIAQIFTISCNNLAFNYEKLEKIKSAEKMLKRAIYFLLLQSNNKLLDQQEIQLELKKAMFNYTDFADRHNIEIQNTQKVFADIREQITPD